MIHVKLNQTKYTNKDTINTHNKKVLFAVSMINSNFVYSNMYNLYKLKDMYKKVSTFYIIQKFLCISLENNITNHGRNLQSEFRLVT